MYPRARVITFWQQGGVCRCCARKICRAEGRAFRRSLKRCEDQPAEASEALFRRSREDIRSAGPIPGCLLDRFSLENAAESPQMRKRISAPFARWQHAIAAVIERAVTPKELPAHTDPESLAGFCSTAGRGRYCVRKLTRATLRSKRLCTAYLTSC